MENKLIGKRAVITNPKTVKHYQISGTPRTGRVIEYDRNVYLGTMWTPYLVQLDDGMTTWRNREEFKVIRG